MTLGSCYSGIGGADAGFSAAGWQVIYQAEADMFRRAVLQNHWPDARRFRDIAEVAKEVSHRPDVCYAELPDAALERWWPALFAVAQAHVPQWLVVECSPSVPCDDILRDLAMAQWSFRVVQVGIKLGTSSLPEEDWHVRQRLFIFATRDRAAAHALPLRGFSANIEVNVGAIAVPPATPEFYEASMGLPARWSCVCAETPCSCGIGSRLRALSEATSPYLTMWMAHMLDGRWTSDQGYDMPFDADALLH